MSGRESESIQLGQYLMDPGLRPCQEDLLTEQAEAGTW